MVKHKDQNQENYTNKASDHDTLSLNSTLYLAYRDVNELLNRHLYKNIKNNNLRVLDFGCGVGLSTQIISQQIQKNSEYTLSITGVDINPENLKLAKQKLPDGKFILITPEKTLNALGQFDLIICNFVLVEMQFKEMLLTLTQLRSRLSEQGIILITNPTARAYRFENQWYTFNNQFEENKPKIKLESHNKLKFQEDQEIKVQVFSSKESDQNFIFHDYFHSGSAYRKAYASASLQLLETYKPIGKPEDNIKWEAEQTTPPYKMHILNCSSSE